MHVLPNTEKREKLLTKKTFSPYCHTVAAWDLERVHLLIALLCHWELWKWSGNIGLFCELLGDQWMKSR